MPFTFDPATGLYYDGAGHRVAAARLAEALDALTQQASDELGALTGRVLSGDLGTLEWRAACQEVLRQLHVAAAAVGFGGTEQLDASARGWIGSQLRAQYDYLSRFALDLVQGTVSDAQAHARIDQYANMAWATYQRARGRQLAGQGFTQERNVLSAVHHCDECSSLAGRGWVPLGTLPPVGGRECRANCRCHIEYGERVLAGVVG